MAAVPTQGAVDPWVIQPRERERYEEQFKSLKPVNGIVTGDQAKGFLLQSQLPPQLLALIWGLADTDSDGKMNINEFSIACKLINLKLRGFELPKTLPPSLLQIVKAPAATVPVAPVAGNLSENGAPPIPPFPSAANLQRVSAVPTMPVAPIMSAAPITTQPVASAPIAPMMAAPPLIPQVPSTMAPGIPPAIPRMPTMTSAGGVPAVPGMPPTMSMQPMSGIPAVPSAPIPATGMPVSGGMPLGGVPVTGVPGVPLTGIPGVPVTGVLPGAPIVPGAQTMPMSGVLPTSGMPGVPVQGVPGMPGVPGAPAVPRPPGVVPLPLTQTAPGPPSLVGTPNSVGSGTGSVSEPPLAPAGRLGSVDLTFGSPVLEWAVPHQSKLKYTQMFNTTDRSRSGFLSGFQARSIMVNTGLPQKALAQIWGLADMDSDGRLSSDEFVLAMHLCDMAKAGEKIPAVLPLDLIPPAFRRQQANAPATTSPAGQGPEKLVDQDAAATLMNNVTFEDKRKENFEKGQAELERRRKSLLEVQRKEQEERERKEREEQEKREKIRLEQERRRQEEMEKQLQRQRELEQEREQQIRYQQEQREAARRELERQRQLEWEKQRSQELQQARQREQEKVLRLKAQNQTLGIELSQLNEKVKELTTKISETRLGVANVKTTIDGMRGTRDSQMAEMTALKAKLKEQNNRLLSVTAEKARLEQKNKRNQEFNDTSKESMAEATTNKQIALKQLKDRLADLETEITAKVDDMKNNNTQLGDLKSELTTLVSECDQLWSTYEERRGKVKQMKTRLRSDPNEAWGDSAWSAPPDRSSSWAEEGDVVIPSTGKKALLRYRALYEFVARSGDEISFQPGDIILVPVQQNAEPGWLAGEIRGHTGWFPESYVEPIDVPKPAMGEAGDLPEEKVSPVLSARALEGIAEVPENIVDPTVDLSAVVVPPVAAEPVDATTGQLPPEEQEYYTALYPYQSTEAGDLCFQQGEVILVVKKEGDWWTGVVGDRTGIFPSNYVQKADDQPATTVPPETVEPTNEPEPQPEPETAAVKESAPPPTEAQPVLQEKPATPDFAVLNSSTPLEEDADGKGTKSKKPEIATVMAPYTATSAEQLNLSRGQLIMIRKKSSTGWWEGELQAKGQKRQVGWFPASYVKLLGGQGARKSQDVSASSTPPATSASPVPTATGSEPNLEKVIALYQYTAQNEDELSFEKDDVITLLAKEEAAWWRGELNGVSGLFPSNYVAPVSVEMLRGTERKRQDSIDELIYTEQAYIDDMSVVHDVFEKPLLEKQILTPELIQKIFVNWEEIIVCNYMFLRALRVRREMSSGGVIRMIGDILCENLPRMNVYVRFCSCQLSAAATLQMLTENNNEFREATRVCQNDPRTKGMPLSSFLIKPMQRITKYPLLIKKILQYTPSDHPDYTYLQEALSKAEEFCTQVNEGVREKENSDRLEWLQQHVIFEGLEEKITFNSLTNCVGSRKFLHHGVLVKAKSGKELVAFLMNDFLLLTRPSKTLGSNRQFSFERCNNISLKLYKEPIILNEMRILDESSGINGKISPLDGGLISGDTTALRIEHVESKTLHSFLAPSVNERNLWYKKLEAAQRNFLENEKSHFQRQQSKQAQFGAVGRILAVVMSGSGFSPVSPGGKGEIFCKVSMGSQGQRTPVAAGPNPQWQASMQFLVKDLQEDSLCITVFERGQFKPDEFLGRTEIRIQDINQASGRMPGPITKQLKLHEVDTGEVEVKLDLRLFHR